MVVVARGGTFPEVASGWWRVSLTGCEAGARAAK